MPFPPPGDLPLGIEPVSPTLQADSLPSEPPRKPNKKREHKKEREIQKRVGERERVRLTENEKLEVTGNL